MDGAAGAPTAASGAATVGEDICAACLKGPLESSLVLACEHKLCLSCASGLLQCPVQGQAKVQCPCCGSITDVEASAAKHLRSLVGAIPNGKAPLERPLPSSALPAPPALLPPVPPPPPMWGRGATNGAGDLCGQCMAIPAEVDCRECGERFCGRCSANIHQRGRMREHTLYPRDRGGAGADRGGSRQAYAAVSTATAAQQSLSRSPSGGPGGVGAGGSAVLADGGGGARHRNPSPIFGQFIGCPLHPEDPLQFFCLDCEECICAECAVHGAHRGHDVLNVRLAYKKLSGRISELLEASQCRAEEHTRAMQQAATQRRDVDLVIARGRRSIQEAFERLRVTLSQKEAHLLLAADACERAAAERLTQRTTMAEDCARAIKEAQGALTKVDSRGDEVRVLNSYAVARARVLKGLEPGLESGRQLEYDLEDLRNQVRNALDLQVAQVSAIGDRAAELRRSSERERERERGSGD